MQGFRLLLAVAVGLVALIAGDALEAEPLALVVVTAGYLALSGLTHLAWRVSRKAAARRSSALMLMVDGVYLAWTSYATGGAVSPLRFVIALHLVTVALLASYRTGMKLALWHSLLLLVLYYAQEARCSRRSTSAPGAVGSPFEMLIAYSLIFWFVAIATASFSAVNERELRRRRVDLEALAALATRLEGDRGLRGRGRHRARGHRRRVRVRARRAVRRARPTTSWSCSRTPARSSPACRRSTWRTSRCCATAMDSQRAPAGLEARRGRRPVARRAPAGRPPARRRAALGRGPLDRRPGRRALAARRARASSTASCRWSSASARTAPWRCATPGCSSRSARWRRPTA